MSAPSVRNQFADTMLAVGQSDPNLVVLVGDISHGILQPFAAACAGRYYNVGILEPTTMSMAAGLARVGLTPVVHTIAPFLIERSFEQIKLDFCYHGLHGNIVTVGSAFDYAALGCSHHCYGDFALLKTLPNIQITYPATPVEFDSLFRQAYANDAVTYYRLPARQHEVEFSPSDIAMGEAIKVKDGGDLTLIATGPQLQTALRALEGLAAMGWDPEILYIHTIRPLDEDAVRASVAKTRNVIVLEEHMRSGGLGDEVLRTVRDLPEVHFEYLAIPDVFVTGYGSYDDHCETCGLTPRGLIDLVSREFGERKAA